MSSRSHGWADYESGQNANFSFKAYSRDAHIQVLTIIILFQTHLQSI